MPYTLLFLLALTIVVGEARAVEAGHREYFEPSHRLLGIGAERAGVTDRVVALRTERMIESQTFVILRDPRAVEGAQRIFSRRLQALFTTAERSSGVPASLLAAIAYLESWGESRAQSPSGPRGIMQIAAGTARTMGLKITYRTRYRIQTRTRRVKTRSGKWVKRRVRTRIPYTVLVRDERLIPERAIPAAASYLARLSEKFGSEDWAVFAYHCGEGCATAMRDLTAKADGIPAPHTVAKMFFSASPAANRDLYLALEHHMQRDYSPTYWFRVMRARQLLELYRKDPSAFRAMAADFRYGTGPKRRAPHRLAVWLDGEELLKTCDNTGRHSEPDILRALDDPDYYGFRLRTAAAGNSQCLLASPSAIGTLAYIAFETRRLHEAMDLRDERFVPLEVTSLARPSASPISSDGEPNLHATGHVFDIDYNNLPPGQREAFKFVLNDLGWQGYLGFVRAETDRRTMHIGCSPSSRDFFDEVFAEALDSGDGKSRSRRTGGRVSRGDSL